jgi:hypothetical protein
LFPPLGKQTRCFAIDSSHFLNHIRSIHVAFLYKRKPFLADIEGPERGIRKKYDFDFSGIVDAVGEAACNISHGDLEFEDLFEFELLYSVLYLD